MLCLWCVVVSVTSSMECVCVCACVCASALSCTTHRSLSLSLYPCQSFSQLVPGTAGPLKLVHKKIRLSEDLLSWEHERFSLKRLPAATLSSLHSHQDTRRHSMFVNR